VPEDRVLSSQNAGPDLWPFPGAAHNPGPLEVPPAIPAALPAAAAVPVLCHGAARAHQGQLGTSTPWTRLLSQGKGSSRGRSSSRAAGASGQDSMRYTGLPEESRRAQGAQRVQRARGAGPRAGRSQSAVGAQGSEGAHGDSDSPVPVSLYPREDPGVPSGRRPNSQQFWYCWAHCCVGWWRGRGRSDSLCARRGGTETGCTDRQWGPRCA